MFKRQERIKVREMTVTLLSHYYSDFSGLWALCFLGLKITLLEHFFGKVWAPVQAPAGLAHGKWGKLGHLSLALSCLVSRASSCASAIKNNAAIGQLFLAPSIVHECDPFL